MVSACVKSFEPGATRNNFVVGVIVTLVSAPASVAMVNDSPAIALIVPKTGGFFAGEVAGVPVCASAQAAPASVTQRQIPARTALLAKTRRVSNPRFCIPLSPSSLDWAGARGGLDKLRCRAGETYCLDAATRVSRSEERRVGKGVDLGGRR